MHAYNCPENKIEFIFEATWGDSVAGTLPQGANIIMITPCKNRCEYIFEQKQLRGFMSPNF